MHRPLIKAIRRLSTPRHYQALRHSIVSAAAFFVLGAAVHLTTESQRSRLEQEARAETFNEAASLSAKLEAQINSNVFLANGMIAFVATKDSIEEAEIRTAMAALYRQGRHLRNIAVAPQNRIRYVHPYEGNEAAIGIYYPDLAEQWEAVQRAIESRSTVLAGPLELRQGGTGLVSRTPVFLSDGSYWGVVTLVLNIESVFQAAGLHPEFPGHEVAVRGSDGKGAT